MRFSSFWKTLGKSISRTNSQLFVLSKAGILLFLFFVADYAIGILLLLAGYFLKSKLGTAIEFLSVAYLCFLLLKYNGAWGLVLTEVSMSDIGSRPKVWRTVRNAVKNGWVFFRNAFGAGVILFCGQILLACPCFLVRSNFIFSPFLYVYENMQWKEGRQRSRELSHGLGWFVLGRTLGLLLIGYALLVIAIIFLFTGLYWVGIILALAILYLSVVQSNFIWIFYNEVLYATAEQRVTPATLKYKVMLMLTFSLVAIIYLVFKGLPH